MGLPFLHFAIEQFIVGSIRGESDDFSVDAFLG